MSGRGMQGSLSVQADRLKKTMQNRDQRRRKEQNQRAARNDQLDPYERSQKATGGVRLGPGSAALAAVADVAALEGPAILRCEPCQATFSTEAQLQQHNEGPTHRKALARIQALQEKKRRMGQNSGAAEAALAAAAWAGAAGGEPACVARQQQEETLEPAPEPLLPGVRQAPGLQQPSSSGMMPQQLHAGRGQQGHAKQPQGPPGASGPPRPSGPQGGFNKPQGPPGPSGAMRPAEAPGRAGPKLGAAAKAAQANAMLQHQDLVAKARHREEQLLIGGWAPPSISNPPAAASPMPAEPSRESANPPAGVAKEDSEEAAEAESSDGPGDAAGLVAYGSGDSDSHDDSSDGSSGLDEDAPQLTSFF